MEVVLLCEHYFNSSSATILSLTSCHSSVDSRYFGVPAVDIVSLIELC